MSTVDDWSVLLKDYSMGTRRTSGRRAVLSALVSTLGTRNNLDALSHSTYLAAKRRRLAVNWSATAEDPRWSSRSNVLTTSRPDPCLKLAASRPDV